MNRKYLSKTHTRNFSSLNLYKRTLGKDGQSTNKEAWDTWECKYTGETVGYSYEEDQQGYQRIQEYDKKHGTNNAEWYEHFHELWYWDNIDEDWARDLRNGRDKDLYTNSQRVDLLDISNSEEAGATEVTHNPSVGLDLMEKTAEEVPNSRPKTRYSAGDYQYTINPLSPRWADLLIKRIDYERGVSENNELDVGIIFLSRGKSRWGFNSSYHGLWVITLYFAGEEPRRVATINRDHAQDIMDKLRKEYKEHAVSREDPEFFMIEMCKGESDEV